MKNLVPLATICLMMAAWQTEARGESPSEYVNRLREPIPTEWHPEPQYMQQLPTDDNWWRTLGDTTLVRLIEMAESNNFDVMAAAQRIEAARQSLKEARAAYYPTVSANAGWQKGQTSGREGRVTAPAEGFSYFSLGLDMQWEIDVFGRVRANADVEKQNYNATRAEYAAVMVSLAANMAKAYITLRLYQEEYEVAKAHIAQQEKVTHITEVRFDTGLGNMLEVNQSRVVLYSTEATLPGLEAMIETSVNAIALLAGVYPSEIAEMLREPSGLPERVRGFGTGVPMELLRRRPDVVEAELQMATYAAQVGVAKKDFLPTLSLTGSIATTSRSAKGLFGSHSLAYTVAPQLSWTVFDGLARNYRVAEAKANLEAAIDAYNQTVMTAVQEVDNAISSYEAAVRSIELYKKVIEASQEAVTLSIDRYKQGLSEFTAVASAQMDYLTYQNSLVGAKAQALTALVTLYDALGGGWDGVLPE